MALRVDLRIRKNYSNKDFVEALSKFCRDYAWEHDCPIEFEETPYPDIKFHWWDSAKLQDSLGDYRPYKEI